MSGAATRRSTSDTARWAATTVIIGSVVCAVMVLLGMEPRLALVAVVVLLVTAATRLISDLAAIAAPLSWYKHGSAADSSSRPDRRVPLTPSR
jgi:uncharacterized membrane protein YphA (DoxX/SURF4 family)